MVVSPANCPLPTHAVTDSRVGQPASIATIYCTTTVPCIKGWIEQMYAYVPGVVKV